MVQIFALVKMFDLVAEYYCCPHPISTHTGRCSGTEGVFVCSWVHMQSVLQDHVRNTSPKRLLAVHNHCKSPACVGNDDVPVPGSQDVVS